MVSGSAVKLHANWVYFHFFLCLFAKPCASQGKLKTKKRRNQIETVMLRNQIETVLLGVSTRYNN